MDPIMNHPVHPISPQQAVARADSSIGGLLLEAGKITPDNAERVWRLQKELGIRFGEAALRLGLINDADIAQVLARQFDYPSLQQGEHTHSPLLVAAYPPFSQQVERLRAVRKRLADAEGVPAYIVFSDAVLRQMAARVPRSRAEMLALSGIGPVKLERYGESFLKALRAEP
jgi:superfamily II DNA helicase RecQ